jgi:hypothetical protein
VITVEEHGYIHGYLNKWDGEKKHSQELREQFIALLMGWA